ncbi:MAG: type II secretion system protein [Ruminococcaceae bacterium]|nr:type II secretion system protein [Oscillospiraceae bacterium]
MKKLFSKKAFTLVEVLIATAITGLLIAAVMALFGPVRNLINDLDGDVNINNTTDSIQEFFHARLNKTIGYNIDIYEPTAEAASYTDSTSIGHRVETMLNTTDLSVTTHCVLLKYENGGYYIYDLGRVESGADFDAKYASLSSHKLFNEEYYSGAKYRFTFKTITDTNTNEWWYQMGITPYDENGQLLLETRTSLFRMVNNSSSPQSNAALENTNYIDLENNKTPTIAIIYNIKDYSDLNYVPVAP